MRTMMLATAGLLLAGTAWGASVPAYVAQAVANPARPAADRAADAERKPAESLAFSGIKPGDVVVDMLPGQGYFTQLFCGVVGSSGQVFQLRFPEHHGGGGAMMAMKPHGGAAGGAMMAMKPPGGAMMMHAGPPPAPAPICAVTKLNQPPTQIATPVPVDLIWTSRNYHDLHNPIFGSPDMLAVDKSIYAALKPGGVFIVLDHADAPGTGIKDTNTLHRIDEAAVKQEVEAAGFTLAGESEVLRNPADDHSKPVFDPSIKGHTDQFLLKFRRPS